jgi:BirA family biotin operon repressor/biotin-[acetyl-CoA-carboxylase] ligase
LLGDRARLPVYAALAPFYRCVHFAEAGSTNDDAKQLAADGAPEGTLIWADVQTAGRGRRGRVWQSPVGNLYMSLVLRPQAPLSDFGQIGFVAGLAIAEAISYLLRPKGGVACKWPNDVLIGGQKVAGLLLESEGRIDVQAQDRGWLVLGIGVNVASYPSDVEYPATSLAAAGRSFPVGDVLSAVCDRFDAWYATWRNQGFEPLRSAWLKRAAGVGGPITVRLEDRVLDGHFAGLDEDGALLLHSAGTADTDPLRVTAGDVFFPAVNAQAG